MGQRVNCPRHYRQSGRLCPARPGRFRGWLLDGHSFIMVMGLLLSCPFPLAASLITTLDPLAPTPNPAAPNLTSPGPLFLFWLFRGMDAGRAAPQSRAHGSLAGNRRRHAPRYPPYLLLSPSQPAASESASAASMSPWSLLPNHPRCSPIAAAAPSCLSCFLLLSLSCPLPPSCT